MDKCKVNFVIDCLLMICLATIAGIGFLMAWIMPPGKERNEMYGSGTDLYFLNMDRHGWGKVHLIFGLVMLGLIVLHIVLHWSQIVVIYRRLISSPALRKALAWVFAVACLFLLVYPFAIKPSVSSGLSTRRGPGQVRHQQEIIPEDRRESPDSAGISEQQNEPGQAAGSEKHGGYTKNGVRVEIIGRMTLSEVSAAYNVPVEYIISGLGLPKATSSAEKLGWLRRTYGFKMSDVEVVVIKYLDTH